MESERLAAEKLHDQDLTGEKNELIRAKKQQDRRTN
jgi:hypothetical protein